MPQDVLKTIMIRNHFYRESHHKMVMINMLLIIFVLLLCIFIYYQSYTSPQPLYFPATPDGQIVNVPLLSTNHLMLKNVPVTPAGNIVDLPTVNINELKYKDYVYQQGTTEYPGKHALILHWTENAVLSLFDMDFVNYRKTLQGVRDYFTQKGHELFLIAFAESRNLETVTKRQQVVSASIAGQSVITDYGRLTNAQNRVYWRLEVPIDVVYENVRDPKPLTQALLAKVFVIRVSTLQSPFYGLAISRINFSPRE